MSRTIGTLLALLLCSTVMMGCTSTVQESVLPEELTSSSYDHISEVTLNNGTIIRFDELGGHVVTTMTGQSFTSTVVGYSWDKVKVEENFNSVLAAKIGKEKIQTANTMGIIILSVSVVVGGLVTAFAIAMSGV